MGLILGLHTFVEAHPDTSTSAVLGREAQGLWAGAQSFVADHGFPYSSQRIQNLSTLLSSSTSVIWFIDVYDALEGTAQDLDRPLLHYARDFDGAIAQAFFQNAYVSLKSKTPGPKTTPAPALLPSGVVDGESYTLVESQALAALVALAQGDLPQATSWLAPLRVSLLQTGEDAPYLFSAALQTETGAPWGPENMGAHWLLVYAMVEQSGFLEGRAREEAQSDWKRLLDTLMTQAWIEAPGPLAGLFRADMPSEHQNDRARSQTGDNILAYFALGAAAKQLPSPEAEALQETKTKLGDPLAFLCGGTDSRSPTATVFADGTSVRADSPRTYGLCALFFVDRGELDRAEQLLFDLARRRRLEPEHFDLDSVLEREANLATFKDGRSWADLAAETLARRALAPLDPRQEEMALDLLAPLLSLSLEESLFEVIAASLLAADPNGLFDIDRGPVLLTQKPFDPGGFRSLGYGADAEAKNVGQVYQGLRRDLTELFFDALRAFLLSGAREVRFDLNFYRLVQLRFALGQAEALIPPDEWSSAYAQSRSDWILRTDYELRSWCSFSDQFEATGRNPDHGLGVSCERVERMFRRFREARVGEDENLEGSLGRETPFPLTRLAHALRSRRYTARTELRTEADASSGCLSCGFLPVELELGQEASVVEIQDAWRQALQTQVQEALDLNPDAPLLLDTPALDLVGALNPSSPSYWTRGSLFLRAGLSHPQNLLRNCSFWGA